MKLNTTTIVLVFILFSISSCNKDYNCVCENIVIFPAYENQNNQYVPQEIVQQQYSNTIRTSKKNVASECEKSENEINYNYPSTQGYGPVISTTECIIQ